MVARLRGCLGELPDSQRELLELRTGLTGARPLSPRTAAARLRIGGARFARLEAQAVRELGGVASTSGCAQLPEIVAGVASYLNARFGTQPAGARGGVEAARYEAPPGTPGPISVPTSASSSHGLLGTDIPPVAGGVILLLLALLAAALAVSAVLADAAGQGPRHAQWRARMIERFHPKG